MHSRHFYLLSQAQGPPRARESRAGERGGCREGPVLLPPALPWQLRTSEHPPYVPCWVVSPVCPRTTPGLSRFTEEGAEPGEAKSRVRGMTVAQRSKVTWQVHIIQLREQYPSEGKSSCTHCL